ncbi:hypothetical protein IFM89_037941 [Coptis chinensis]|uniref:Uncharacterized protein n=1 Tax=Coptis chinensis TaxID=261450 RepID=A0A835HT70_9MAGN|nr:hypothetical protein IFM89_037941 [Coptis chinensis]
MRGIRRQNPWMYLEDIVKEYQPEFVCIAEPLIRPPAQLPLALVKWGIFGFVGGRESAYGIRRALWAELSQLGLAVKPWAVVGDFNIVSEISERKGGRTPCLVAMSDFNSFIHSNALIDSTTMGFKYSWCNKRMGYRRMYQKIDRMLVNQRWMDVSAGWRSRILKRRHSDHCPIVGWNTKIPKPSNIPFRFKQAWVQHENLREVVERSWKEPLHDAPIRKVVKKLKRLKIVLKEWSWRVYGNTKQHLKELEGELENILKEQEQDPFNSKLHNQEVEKATEIQAVKDVEILTLRQKARVTDALEGERNSKYFHAITKIRLAKSQIVEIQDDQGNKLTQ